MTQAASKPNPITETHWVTGGDAAELARLVGCLVVQVGPTRGVPEWVEAHKANQRADELTRQHPDRMYVVMVLGRAYHGTKYKAPASESEASA
jgi:hypothetical protein